VAGRKQTALTRGPPTPKGIEGLSPKERRVLELLALAKSTDEIAAAMGMSPGAVYVYVHRLMVKLDVTDRLGAVVLYYQAVVRKLKARRP